MKLRSTVGWANASSAQHATRRANEISQSRHAGCKVFFIVNPADKNVHFLVEHLHAISRLPEVDADFPIRWSLTKAAFSSAIPLKGMIRRSRKIKRERGISF
ncbi:MAG: hypothetical protein Q7J77_04585 [Undibacterium sp.]|nr:hypothetical protein [Undibacterium sp.]